MSSYEFSHEALCLLLEERDAKIGRLVGELEVIKGLYDIASDGYLQVKDQLAEANGALEHMEMLYTYESKQLSKAEAELSTYKSAMQVIGELSTYPLRSKIVFDGNSKIPELQGIDGQRVRVLIMKLED